MSLRTSPSPARAVAVLVAPVVAGILLSACSGGGPAADDGAAPRSDGYDAGSGGAASGEDAAGGGDGADGSDTGVDGGADGSVAGLEAAEARLDAIDAAVTRWQEAATLPEATTAAEEARNLVTGADTFGAGDLDGDGSVAGDEAEGLLPGEDGRPGLAGALAGCELVDRDVLGGSWDDPADRWAILGQAIADWRADDNTFPDLPSHPQRIIGWASLALDGADLDHALEYAGHARLHVDVSRAALDSCR